MNAHQRRLHRRESERAFQHFRRAGIPVEQAHHWAEARATRIVAEDSYNPERPTDVLWIIRKVMVAGVALAVLCAVAAAYVLTVEAFK